MHMVLTSCHLYKLPLHHEIELMTNGMLHEILLLLCLSRIRAYEIPQELKLILPKPFYQNENKSAKLTKEIWYRANNELKIRGNQSWL